MLIMHDYFAIAGGGERLVLILSEHFRAPVLTAFVNKQLYEYIGWRGLIKPILPCLPLSSPLIRAQTAMAIFALIPRRYFLKADTVIYSGNFALLARPGSEGRFHIMYCHTPPRFLSDLKADLLRTIPRHLFPFYHLQLSLYKRLYLSSLRRINVIVANSQNVRRRIKSFADRDSLVVYPPCDISSFKFLGQDDYYLSTARLEPHKNVDRIVKSFKKMPHKKLVVVSGGSQYEDIVRLASDAPNVHVLGWVSENRLKELIGRSIATIYVPTNEDFGMSPVESMAAGKPVIGVNSGGLTETIIHGKTGYLVPEKWTEEDIIQAVEYLNEKRAIQLRYFCEEQAKRFDKMIFLQEMEKIIRSLK